MSLGVETDDVFSRAVRTGNNTAANRSKTALLYVTLAFRPGSRGQSAFRGVIRLKKPSKLIRWSTASNCTRVHHEEVTS